jgi:hypothetical protein
LESNAYTLIPRSSSLPIIWNEKNNTMMVELPENYGTNQCNNYKCLEYTMTCTEVLTNKWRGNISRNLCFTNFNLICDEDNYCIHIDKHIYLNDSNQIEFRYDFYQYDEFYNYSAPSMEEQLWELSKHFEQSNKLNKIQFEQEMQKLTTIKLFLSIMIITSPIKSIEIKILLCLIQMIIKPIPIFIIFGLLWGFNY